MDLFRELSLMTDVEAELCLQGLLKGYAAGNSAFEMLAPQPAQLREALQCVADSIGTPAPALIEPAASEKHKAVRTILVEMASDPVLQPRLEAWIGGSRPTRVDPITGALVLAGIVLVLSTSVDFKYETKNGKRHVKIEVKRKPTTEKLLGKFFGLFGAGAAGGLGDADKGGAGASQR